MSATLLILRPEPGASETAARAAALGLCATVAPIFTIRPLPWQAPNPSEFDAVLLTSANAARHAGGDLARFAGLPCYAVGPATAAAAIAAGFASVRNGADDGAAAAAMMADRHVARALHLCGRDRMPLRGGPVSIEDVPVYAAEAADALPAAAREAIVAGAVALLHSPRAARLFAALADRAGLARDTIALVAISEAAAAAAGGGWKSRLTAARPRDHALLELAAKLCQNGDAATSVGG